MKEVRPEQIVRNHLLDVSAGCRDQSYIDMLFQVATYRRERQRLEDSQKLRLKFDREIPDFVHEQGSQVCRLKPAYSILGGTRESTSNITKQFGFNE